jgi:hypothetical protein
MAKDKKAFVLYADLIHTVEKLPVDVRGELFTLILEYVNDKDPEPDNWQIAGVFEPIKQQLKRDLRKYEERADKSRKNGKLGGRPRKEEKPKKPTGFSKNLELKKKPDTDTVTDTVIDKDIYNINFNNLLSLINSTGGRKFEVINDTVKKKYKSLLKSGYTKEQIFNAIVNAHKDEFHVESNFKHLTPEYFSRPKTIDLHGMKEVKVESKPITGGLYD